MFSYKVKLAFFIFCLGSLFSCGQKTEPEKEQPLGLVGAGVPTELWGTWYSPEGRDILETTPEIRSQESQGYLRISKGQVEVLTICPDGDFSQKKITAIAKSPANVVNGKIEILKYQRSAVASSRGDNCVAEVKDETLAYYVDGTRLTLNINSRKIALLKISNEDLAVLASNSFSERNY